MRTLEERFWDKVDRRGADECWEWTGARKHDGYGVMRPTGQRSGPPAKAHRVSAQLAGMDIEGKFVLHSCDNPPCVNPAHLRPGDRRENFADMVLRGRMARGSRVSKILTELDVERMFQMRAAGMVQREIAEAFGCTQPNVSRILAKKTWGHVHDGTEGGSL